MNATIAGRYQLDPVHIGKGGMGEVWGPGVPVIHDAATAQDGPFQGRLYLVMQLIDGINVDDSPTCTSTAGTTSRPPRRSTG